MCPMGNHNQPRLISPDKGELFFLKTQVVGTSTGGPATHAFPNSPLYENTLQLQLHKYEDLLLYHLDILMYLKNNFDVCTIS